MLTLSYDHKVDCFKSKILSEYLTGETVGVFDIETLGLNPAFCEVILIGLLKVYPDGTCTAKQLFAEKPSEEGEILRALFEELSDCNYLLTYNGKDFDLPFIKKRARHCRLEVPYIPYNLDLYRFLHGHSQLRKVLPNLKQKTVEEYMGCGLSRGDEISGGESVELYKAFVKAEESEEKNAMRKKILLHNHDDILQLYRIFPLITKTDIHKAFFSLGFNVAGRCGWPELAVESMSLASGQLLVKGRYSPSSPAMPKGVTDLLQQNTPAPYFSYIGYRGFDQTYDCQFETDGTFSFSVPLEKKSSSLFVNAYSVIKEKALLEGLGRLGGFVNGFVLFKEAGCWNYKEINHFTKALLCDFMQGCAFPVGR